MKEKRILFSLFFSLFSITLWFVLSKLEIIQAQDQVTFHFNPASANLPPDSNLSLMLDAGSELIGFIKVNVNYDNTKVTLSQEVVTTPLLANVVSVTSTAEANQSGSVLIVLGVSPGDPSPTGDFEVAQLSFSSLTNEVNQNVEVTIDTTNSQVVNNSAVGLGILADLASLTLNYAEPTSTTTPTPTPEPTATPNQDPFSELSLIFNGYAFVDEEFPLEVILNTDSTVSGVDAVIDYDPNSLEVVRVEDKQLLGDTTITDIDAVNGVVRISQLETVGSGFAGQGTVATLVLRSQTVGQKSLSFEYNPPSKADSNVVELASGDDILAKVNNTDFKVVSHPMLNIKLTTPSEDTNLGHTVEGLVRTNDEVWSTGFSTDLNGSAEVGIDDTYIGNLTELIFKVSGFLGKRRMLTITSGGNDVDLGALVAGDLNNDGVVNNVDLALMYDAWFGSGIADYNRDGIVNAADHWILTQNFFEQDE